jgi:hypothetical protein
MNFASTPKLLNEIKPLTPSGIASGIPQIKLYAATFGSTLGMIPDDYWTPATSVVLGRRVHYINVDGLIFYTTDENAATNLALFGATLSNVRALYRQNAKRFAVELGAGAAIAAGINLAQRSSIAYITSQSQTIVAQASLRASFRGFF